MPSPEPSPEPIPVPVPLHRTVAVIGAGPAGLMAAERLAIAGAHVTIFDRMASPARKLLMAGRGGLNLTHSEPLETFMGRYGQSTGQSTGHETGHETGHLQSAVDSFPPTAVVAFAEGLGQATFVGSSGRVFPKAMKASPLLRLAGLGVTLQLNTRWTGWDHTNALTFQAANDQSADRAPLASAMFDATILALGGASWPRLGSDGLWQDTLRAAGVDVAPLRASNVGVLVPWSEHVRARHLGEPLKRITLSLGPALGQNPSEQRVRGEVVITAKGLEGGAIYALSGRIREALSHGEATILIDLRPDISVTDLATRLGAPRAKDSLANFIRKRAGITAAAIAVLREAHGANMPVEPAALAAAIKATPVVVTGLGDLDRAISSAGGVTWGELDPHLMLRARPGVFVAGEMIDWDAPTGGYLLQATFSTACLAADGALQWLKQHNPHAETTP
jgi:uncharacterized flavoprotein (TIGR03862 family)